MKCLVIAFASVAAVVLVGSAALGQGTVPPVTVQLEPRSGSRVAGTLTLTQIAPDKVRIAGEISGHSEGPKGFHIHEIGDCSAPDAVSAGPHFNPHGRKHGGTSGAERHGGDLGNITFDAAGRVSVNVVAEGVTLARGNPDSLVGRAIVVHAQTDDLKTDPTGNAGGRVACGVIGR